MGHQARRSDTVHLRAELVRQVLQLQQATESLERARRVRLNQVILDWEGFREQDSESRLLSNPPHSHWSQWVKPLNRPPTRRTPAVEFDSYLFAADRHQAVARKSALGSRLWFADWRQHALAALRLGLSPSGLVALLRSASVAAPARVAPRRSPQHPAADFAGFAERLENVIFPNAPGSTGPFIHLATGDGLAT